jgi:hypothetical protein
MHVDGACHCGAIAYEAEVEPSAVGICHCTDCQTLTGSPYRVSVPVPFEQFRLLRGEPKRYVKTADSGAKRVQAFCGDCGTPIYACAPEKPAIMSVRWGSIKQRMALAKPRRAIWCASAVPWATNLEEVPAIAGQS